MSRYSEPCLAVVNGAVHTMDPAQPLAEAILVCGRTIAAVGTTEEVRALAPAGTKEIDAAGHTVLPGLNDAHLHLIWFGLSLQRLQLADTTSLAEIVERVAAAVRQTAPGTWVQGNSWNHNVWDEPVMPSRHDLDGVSGDTPVCLSSKDGHSVWCNSAALRLAGVDQSTPDPAGGRIVRDATGRPTGILSDDAMGLVERIIPAPTLAERMQAAEAVCDAALALGITSVQSCEGSDEFAALAALEQAGKLSVRVWHMVRVDTVQEALRLGLRTGWGSDWLRIGHVKMFADGALGSATAEMLAPYEGQPDNLGVGVTTTEELLSTARAAAQGGLASAIHAIGDLANRRVLDMYATLRQELPANRLRHRIEHVQLIEPKDIARLAHLGIVASMQPIHCTQDMYMADRLWGARARQAYVFRDILNAGVPLAFGTDCPVEALNPMPGLYAAVTRQRADGLPIGGWYPQQRLSLDEALYAYTMGGAYASYQEQVKGSLAPGKWADITILSNDIHAGDPSALLDTHATMTIVNGQIAYSA